MDGMNGMNGLMFLEVEPVETGRWSVRDERYEWYAACEF